MSQPSQVRCGVSMCRVWVEGYGEATDGGGWSSKTALGGTGCASATPWTTQPRGRAALPIRAPRWHKDKVIFVQAGVPGANLHCLHLGNIFKLKSDVQFMKYSLFFKALLVMSRNLRLDPHLIKQKPKDKMVYSQFLKKKKSMAKVKESWDSEPQSVHQPGTPALLQDNKSHCYCNFCGWHIIMVSN